MVFQLANPIWIIAVYRFTPTPPTDTPSPSHPAAYFPSPAPPAPPAPAETQNEPPRVPAWLRPRWGSGPGRTPCSPPPSPPVAVRTGLPASGHPGVRPPTA